MVPGGFVRHQMEGRIRIIIPGGRKDASYFKRVKRVLKGCEGIDNVTTNPVTASVLIIHHLPAEELQQCVASQKLFQIETPAPAPLPAAAANISRLIHDVGGTLTRRAQADPNIRAAACVGLFVAGMYQLYRGQVLPSCFHLLGSAMRILSEPGSPQPSECVNDELESQ